MASPSSGATALVIADMTGNHFSREPGGMRSISMAQAAGPWARDAPKTRPEMTIQPSLRWNAASIVKIAKPIPTTTDDQRKICSRP